MGLGLEIRAQIDTENVKGLLLINGGGAVALIAFLPSVLGKPEFAVLAKAILWALLLFQIGLLAAVVHNRLRRVCSLVYENAQANSPSNPNPCHFFGLILKEPCVCMRSTAFMWLSAFLFFVAGLIVVVGGMTNLADYSVSDDQHQSQPAQGSNSVELVCNWYSSRMMENHGPRHVQEYIQVTWKDDGVGKALVSYNMSVTEWDAEVNDLVITLTVRPDSWQMKRIAEDSSTVWAVKYNIDRVSGFFAAYGNVVPNDDENAWYADSIPVLSSHSKFSAEQKNAHCEKVLRKRI